MNTDNLRVKWVEVEASVWEAQQAELKALREELSMHSEACADHVQLIAALESKLAELRQDGLTDSEILTDAHRYCCKYVHADDAPYRFTERGIIEFVRLRIERALNQRLVIKDGLTDDDIDRLARPFVGLGGIERHYEFARAIARHLSSHPTPDDQQAKDAERRGVEWACERFAHHDGSTYADMVLEEYEKQEEV